jgi:preprotein translocase subunit SecG
METKDIFIVILVIIVAIGSRFLRNRKGKGSGLSSFFGGKSGISKSKGTDTNEPGDDYEPYSGK